MEKYFGEESAEKLESEMMSESKRAKGRGKETLFRVTIRNQINQISIADNKANMIISINTIIISLVVAILGSGLDFNNWPALEFSRITVPLAILMIFCFFSAGFSIIAARPKIIQTGDDNPDKMSLLFFGNFREMNLEKYISRMEELLSSNNNIYRCMIIDIYHNGRILDRKYKLLYYSYTLFFIGLSLCVGVYLAFMIIQ